MSIRQSVSTLLHDHVTMSLECIDRMYLNVYVPRLQTDFGVAGFFKNHRSALFASSVLMDRITRPFVDAIAAFAKRNGIPVVTFAKNQRKDDVAKEHLARFTRRNGVLFIGKAQEKAPVFRTEKRRNPQTGLTFPWIIRSTAMVNQYYFYCVDEEFGPFFLKYCSYFPYNAKLYINGHEYLKRQLDKEGIAHEALDNGLQSCADPRRAQEIADSLSSERIAALLRKWQRVLPHPFTQEDRDAGYQYDISILQAEFSLTQVLDRPVSGRLFFEQVIRENLDIGRPDQVQMIFQRRVNKRTPGRFRTRVITEGVTPSLHADYKRTRIKQYYKEGRALRTETTVNDTRDFGIGKRLPNLPALRDIGFKANRRLLDVQRVSHDCTIGEDAFQRAQRPRTLDSQRTSALRFGEPSVHALLNAILVFRMHANGFANRDIREQLATLLGMDPEQITQGCMTYNLRRLRLHDVIRRIPGTHRYQITQQGLRLALVYTRFQARVIRPALSYVMAGGPTPKPETANPFERLQRAVDLCCREAFLAP